MKRRYSDLWAQVIAFENLYRAAWAAVRGKRSHASATGFFVDLEGSLLQLQRELLDRSYEPGEYHTFWIRQPKERLISAAPFRDRVLHHALA